MSKRTNSFPTFTPSTKTNPPTAGFQPANIILSSEINGAVYMSYNFVNSFVNALIAGGKLDDSSIYTYDDTRLGTLITEDFKSWVKNIISQTPTFTTVKCNIDDDYSILYNNLLEFNVTLNDYKYETSYGYSLINFIKRDSSDNSLQSTVQVNWDDLTYSFVNNTTVSQNYVSVDMIPSSLKEASESHNLSSVLAKTFSYSQSSTTITETLQNFLNQHQDLNISSIVVKRQISASYTTLEWIPIIPVRRTSSYMNFDYYYFDKSAGAWTKTTGIESLYTGGEFEVTVTFC